MKLNKLIDKETKEFIDSGAVIDDSTENELTIYARDVKAKIDSGEINSWSHMDIVNAYMKLAGPTMNEKKAAKLRIKLIKTPNKLLIGMLNTAIKMTIKE